ncbi:hypothetical protein SeMB42_g01424 [Synchytrium endobioticum]|uniref:Nucleotide exchange factor Fes1 domain-containing protein n=1 Tax=Synchytrium endobioticum TaxID=286115 RepID=A0A507DHJ4_9FUNG|nr:hypothetical protein SeLEV6574_g00536 [Synchytrium endobioticum]TPX52428.1 hypothetical protein SeMB42_g01425 [Synchytrium endobioticum]TPX52429.1 hypothetical protein SeMB42_g01424 [Synchytrium endobioticum]
MSGGRRITQSDLLQWSILNQATKNEDAKDTPGAARTLEPIDKKWIEIILGKDDSVRMRECVETFTNPHNPLETRILSLDELELLIESIDNANNLRPLNLWKPIIAALDDPDPRVRQYVAWVLGTAIQNNPTSQKDFLESGGLDPIMDRLVKDPDADARAKAAYCISGLLKHNTEALSLYKAKEGFRLFNVALKQPQNAATQKRIVFCLKNLLDMTDDEDESYRTAAHLVAREVEVEGILDSVQSIVSGIVDMQDAHFDTDLVEKILLFIATLAKRHPNTIFLMSRHKLVESIKKLRVGGDGGVDAELVKETIRALNEVM